eukprot:70948_1
MIQSSQFHITCSSINYNINNISTTMSLSAYQYIFALNGIYCGVDGVFNVCKMVGIKQIIIMKHLHYKIIKILLVLLDFVSCNAKHIHNYITMMLLVFKHYIWISEDVIGYIQDQYEHVVYLFLVVMIILSYIFAPFYDIFTNDDCTNNDLMELVVYLFLVQVLILMVYLWCIYVICVVYFYTRKWSTYTIYMYFKRNYLYQMVILMMIMRQNLVLEDIARHYQDEYELVMYLFQVVVVISMGYLCDRYG